MRRLFYLLTIFVTINFMNAQDVKWVHQYGGTGEEITSGIAKDGDGNIYMTGYFTEEAIFGPPEGGVSLTAEAFTDMYVTKASPTGELLWVISISSRIDEPEVPTVSGSAIAADREGNVYVSGSFVGTIDFNIGGTTHSLTSTGDSHDSFLLKLDPNGDIVWVRSISGEDYGSISSIVIDDYQTVNIVGYFHDTYSFESTDGIIQKTSRGGLDLFIAKYSQEGEIYWLNQFGGDGLDVTASTAVNEFSDLFVTGMFSGDAYLNDHLVLSVDSSENNGIFLLSFNMMGEGLVNKIAEIVGTDERSSVGMTFNIRTDNDRNVYVCGDFNPIIEFMPDVNGETVRFEVENNINPSGFVAKIHGDGYLDWATNIVSNTVESASVIYGMEINSEGEVYLNGYVGGNVNLGPFNITNDVFHSFLAKLNADGEFVFAEQFGESYFIESSNSLILTDDGHVYLAGTFEGDVDLNPNPFTTYQASSRGYRDVFLMKVSVDNLGTVENVSQSNYAKIYPNPSNGIYNIESKKDLSGKDYKVYDLSGRLVLSGNVNSKNQVNLSFLSKGMYILKIDQLNSFKLIKN